MSKSDSDTARTLANSSAQLSVRCRALRLAATIALTGVFATAADAQLLALARRQSNNLGTSLRSTTRVGLFGLSGGGSTGNTTRAPTGNAPRTQFRGRRPGGNSFYNGAFIPVSQGTRPIGMQQRIMLRPLGRSASAFYFASPVYSGYGPTFYPGIPSFTDPDTMDAVYRSAITANEMAYHYPVYNELTIANIRDPLTQESLRNAPPPLAETDGAKTTSHSLIDRLERNMQARQLDYSARAYKLLKEGDIIRARSAFESAELAGLEMLPIRGKLLCSITEEHYTTARFYLAKLLAYHDDVFVPDTQPLRELLPNGEQRVEDLTVYLAADARRGNEVDGQLGVQAYILWLDGQRSKALAAADRITVERRNSEYAVMADLMRDQIEKEKTQEDAAEIASGSALDTSP